MSVQAGRKLWTEPAAGAITISFAVAASLVAVLAGCPKGGGPVELVDREPVVQAQPPRDVLVAALADDVALRSFALGVLVRTEPLESALGFAVVGRLSVEQPVQLAAIRGLGDRMPDVRVESLLRSIVVDSATRAVVRSYAALALVSVAPESQRDWFAALPRPLATSGSGVGIPLAARRAGVHGADDELVALLQKGTLPAEPELVRWVGGVPGVPWDDVAARAEPEVRPHAWCAAAIAGFGGATDRAVEDARPRDEDGIADAVDAWVICPSPVASTVLARLPGDVADLGQVARGRGSLGLARRMLDGAAWIDAVHALAARGEQGHAALREWAARQDDVRREVVAVSLVGNALPGDAALVESFRTDASLRTRAAAATIVLGGGAAGK